MNELQCSTCNKTLPIEHFNKRSQITRGYSYHCKECTRQIRAYAKNNNIRKYFVDLIRNAKNGCKKRGISDFEIDADYLVELCSNQQGICPITGINLTFVSGSGVIYSNASIDRIDNTKGYLKNNIQLLCRSANSMKLNMTQKEFENFMDNMTSYWQNKELS